MTTSLKSIAFQYNGTNAPSNPTEFTVYNSSFTTVANGGTCCNWTAPAGTTWVTFEIWGGGASGSGSCCCGGGGSGGAGGYGVKTVTASATGGLAGCSYTICAASSSNICCNTNAGSGYASYVNGYGLSNFCANGGYPTCGTCFLWNSCYFCRFINYCCASSSATGCGSVCGADFSLCAPSGGYIGQTTGGGSQGVQGLGAAAPMTRSGPFADGYFNMSCGNGFTIEFPGGGGATLGCTYNCQCCGIAGAGGLVSVTYG